jgi:hypothetical protein
LTISAWGFVLGVIGFVITLAGFAIALRKLQKLESTTRAAQQAVESFKLRVVQYDAAYDAGEARYALQSSRRHLNNDGWRDVAESYEDARRSMLRLLPILLNDQHNLGPEVERMVDQIDKQCIIVERWLGDPSKPKPNKANINGSLRRHLDIIQRVLHHLEQRTS